MNVPHRCIAPACDQLNCHECNCAVAGDVYDAIYKHIYAQIMRDVARGEYICHRCHLRQSVGVIGVQDW